MSFRTVVYRLKFESTDAQKASRTMSLTVREMGKAADGTSKAVDELSKKLGKDFKGKVEVAIDRTASWAAQQRASTREITNSTKAFEKLSAEYKHLTQNVDQTAEQQEIANAQFKLGAGASQEQKQALAQLVTTYQQKKAAVDADNQATEQARQASQRAEKALEKLSAEYKHLSQNLDQTAEQQEIANAQFKLGAGASEDQKQALAQLVTTYQQKKAAVDADNQVTEQARQASQRTEKALEELSREYSLLSSRIGKSADEQQLLNAQFRLGANATAAQKQQVEQMHNEYVKLRNESIKTQGSLRGLRGIAQSAGYQIADAAVQLQMGTNSLVVVGQQGSQFAAAFGPTGAIVGGVIAVAAAVGTVLVPSLFDANDEMEDMIDNLRNLADTTRLTQEESALLVREEERGIESKKEQIATLREERQALADANKATDQRVSTGQMARRQDQRKKESAEQYGDAVLENVVAEQKLHREIEQSYDNIERYRRAVDVATDTYDNNIEANKRLEEQYKKSKEELGLTRVELTRLEKQRALEVLATQNATAEQIAVAEAYFDAKIQIEQNTEATQKQAQADRDAAVAARQVAAARARTQRSMQQAVAEYERDRQQRHEDGLQRQEQQRAISARLTTEGQLAELERRYDKERALFAHNQDMLNALEDEYNQERMKLTGSAWEQYAARASEAMQSTDEIMIASLDRLTQGFGDFVETAIFDSENIGDAFKTMFEGAARAMVSYFAEYMAQKLIVKAFESTTEATAKTAYATSNSLQNEAMALQASLNAFAATAAIPIVGPTMAPAAATAAFSAAQGIAVASDAAAFSSAAINAFDRGGVIRSGGAGIVAEVGDEMVGGTMIYNGSPNSLRVTGREQTARQVGTGGGPLNITINSSGNATPEAISRALVRTLKRKSKNLDSELFLATNRGRVNKGKRFNA